MSGNGVGEYTAFMGIEFTNGKSCNLGDSSHTKFIFPGHGAYFVSPAVYYSSKYIN